MTINRRALLGAAAAFPFAGPIAHAQGARTSIAISMARDIQGAMDPTTRLSSPEGNILRTVCPGLIAFKPGTFDWELAAAESIRQVSDTEIAFTLKPGQKFHDGFGELTAEDVKFSFERFRVPGADGRLPTHTKDWEALDRIEVTAPLSGRILLKTPAPALWLTVLPDVSGCIVSAKAFDAGAYRTDRPPLRVIGVGAYQLAEWVPNQRVVLRAYPAYVGPKPTYPEVVLRPVRDPKTAELALRADELQFTRIDPATAADVARVQGLKVISQDSINFIWVGINVEKPPFNDVRVRQAIRAAIDVDQVIAGAYNGAVGRANGIIAPGLLGHWDAAPNYTRDVAAARKLLADAGHGRGLRAKLTLLNQPAYQAAGQIIQAMLSEVGITLELQVLDGGAFWSMGRGEAGQGLELSLQRFGGKADPAFQMQWFTSDQVGNWNWQRWQSPEFDTLFSQGASTMDVAARNRAYLRMQQLMDESAAYIWLTHERNVFGHRAWLAPAVLPNGDDQLFHRFGLA
jgi:peptide/nickel transport system substrate-binding protein